MEVHFWQASVTNRLSGWPPKNCRSTAETLTGMQWFAVSLPSGFPILPSTKHQFMDIVLFAFEDDAADELPQRIVVTVHSSLNISYENTTSRRVSIQVGGRSPSGFTLIRFAHFSPISEPFPKASL